MGSTHMAVMPKYEKVSRRADKIEKKACSTPSQHVVARISMSLMCMTMSTDIAFRLAVTHARVVSVIRELRKANDANVYDERIAALFRQIVDLERRFADLQRKARAFALPRAILEGTARVLRRYIEDITMSEAAARLLDGLAEVRLDEEALRSLVHAK